jgi:rRNA-processing protein FCF1
VRAVKKTVEENKENAAAQTSQITQTIVATNDAELRKRIKALGSKVIYLRARKHLEITN